MFPRFIHTFATAQDKNAEIQRKAVKHRLSKKILSRVTDEKAEYYQAKASISQFLFQLSY